MSGSSPATSLGSFDGSLVFATVLLTQAVAGWTVSPATLPNPFGPPPQICGPGTRRTEHENFGKRQFRRIGRTEATYERQPLQQAIR